MNVYVQMSNKIETKNELQICTNSIDDFEQILKKQLNANENAIENMSKQKINENRCQKMRNRIKNKQTK